MASRTCLNFSQIVKYIRKKSSSHEAAIIEKEILKCEKCANEVEFLQSIYQSSKKKINDDAREESTVQPESFFSYEKKLFDGDLTEDEQGEFYDALLNSPEYFDGFKDILRCVQKSSEISREEKKILNQIESANIKDRLTQHEKKFRHHRKQNPGSPKRPFRFPDFNYSKPALLFAGAAVVSFIALFSYLNYQKNHLEETFLLAETDYNATVQRLPFTLEELRLSGTKREEFVKYRFTRSGDDKSASHNSDNIEKAVQLRPNDPKLNHKMGVMKYLNGHSAEAEIFLKKSIRLDANYTPAYNDLSLIKIDQGKSKEALKLLQTALKITPDFLEAQFNLAILYEQLKKNNKAISAWREYLKNESNKGIIKAVKLRIEELQN